MSTLTISASIRHRAVLTTWFLLCLLVLQSLSGVTNLLRIQDDDPITLSICSAGGLMVQQDAPSEQDEADAPMPPQCLLCQAGGIFPVNLASIVLFFLLLPDVSGKTHFPDDTTIIATAPAWHHVPARAPPAIT